MTVQIFLFVNIYWSLERFLEGTIGKDEKEGRGVEQIVYIKGKG